MNNENTIPTKSQTETYDAKAIMQQLAKEALEWAAPVYDGGNSGAGTHCDGHWACDPCDDYTYCSGFKLSNQSITIDGIEFCVSATWDGEDNPTLSTATLEICSEAEDLCMTENEYDALLSELHTAAEKVFECNFSSYYPEICF